MTLTDDDVNEIRHYAALGVRQVDIALRFNVTQATVSRILSGKRRLAVAPLMFIRRIGPAVVCAVRR